MIKQHGLVQMMSEEECLKTIDVLDSLENHWTLRSRSGLNIFYTLGAASYLDSSRGSRPNQYADSSIKMNSILKENFSYLYKLLIETMEPLVGKCALEEDLGIPGFQIFGLKKKNMKEANPIPNLGYSTDLHSDKASYDHKNVWSKYKEVEDDLLTITVAIDIHKNGSGLVVWDKDMEIDSNTVYANSIKRNSMDDLNRIKSVSAYPVNVDKVLEFDMDKPNIVEYFKGSLFYVIGDPWHQIAPPLNAKTDERRITLQAHALKCDGIWRLHF
jgi:hypothetical protein